MTPKIDSAISTLGSCPKHEKQMENEIKCLGPI